MRDRIRQYDRDCQDGRSCYGVAVAEPAYDLRERKRTKTRLMIQAEAMRLFAEKGYEHTTVDEIAYAAAISPRTFFRYFPTREDVVLWDEYDPIAPDLFAARPADEPLAQTLRAVVREALGGLYQRDRDALLLRARLLMTVPELRARLRDQQREGEKLMAALVAQQRGLPPDELGAQVLASAFGSAILVALEAWVSDNGESDLIALLDRALDALAAGMRELAPLSGER
jgi:AcrR family transcriptional regulator